MVSGAPSAPNSGGGAFVAKVWIGEVAIRGFRSLDNFTVGLEPDTTFLVGENNTGKSSLLAAMTAALGRSRPTSDDLTRHSDGAVADKAVVDLTVFSGEGESFGDYERGAFGGNVHRHPTQAREFVGIRSSFTRSRESDQLLVNRSFLQPGRNGLIESSTEFLPKALSIFECELLDAARDLVTDFGSKTSRWGRVLFDLQIPELPLDGVEPNRLSRSSLEAELVRLAADMREASPVLSKLEEDLSRIKAIQNTVGDVSLLPFPPRIEEMMRSVEVILSRGDSPQLPLRFHGLGSRSLAALFVFATLCALRLGADDELRPHFVTLIEEPESHLHPQAVSALRLQLNSMPGQRIVSTHSSRLVEEAPPRCLRVLRRTSTGFNVYNLSASTLADTARFRRFVERPFGEFFFSRVIVFGDGATERDALPRMLEHALGVAPSSLGVTVVDSESLANPQVPKLIAAAEELGLPWLVFADNDAQGIAALANIVDPRTGTALDPNSSRVVVAGSKAIERMLLDAGYGDEVIAIANEQKVTVATEQDQLKYLASNKGWVGESVVSLALQNEKGVPQPVHELAGRIREVLGLGSEVGEEE